MKHSWARPGTKCVCIAPAWRRHDTHEPTEGPQQRRVYTVAKAAKRDDGRVYIELVGLRGRFCASGFRPLTERSVAEDVALFRHLLTPTPTLARA